MLNHEIDGFGSRSLKVILRRNLTSISPTFAVSVVSAVRTYNIVTVLAHMFMSLMPLFRKHRTSLVTMCVRTLRICHLRIAYHSCLYAFICVRLPLFAVTLLCNICIAMFIFAYMVINSHICIRMSMV